MRDRSESRARSPTPAPAEDTTRNDSRSPSRHADDDRPNGTRNRSRSRTRSPSRSRSRSRSRSPSYRTHSRSPSPPRSAKIVIEKLTKNVNAAHLREIFSTYGDIAELEMPMNKQFMTNRGIAYILYSTASHAEAAIAHMHEAQLDGALISVSIVLPRRRFSRSPPPRRPPPNRFGEPHRMREPGPRGPAPDRAYGRPIPPRAEPGYRRSPPGGFRGGRGGGYRDRFDERNSYRPRSYSPSRSPPSRRRRSPSRSRSPRRESPGGRFGGAGGRRRSPSFSSYGSRSRSRERGRR